MKIAIYAGMGEGDIGEIARIEINGELVLTTTQLAQFYGCKSTHIIDNFNNHAEHFVKGKHFFKLDGDDLKNFKKHIDNIHAVDNQAENFRSVPYVGKHTANLFLWTARGTARHAKMLSTQKAWDVFEMLEDNYFNSPKISEKKTSEKISKNGLTDEKKIKFLLQAAKITKDAVRRENLIATAEKIIIG